MSHKIVLAGGCFDLFHVAHLRYLQEARTFGTLLVVGVTEDAGVHKGPGRPVIPQDERLEIVRWLTFVHEAHLCKNALEALEYWKPQVYAKGADYLEKGLPKDEVDYCNAHGIEIRHTKPNPQTTSGIIERVQCAF